MSSAPCPDEPAEYRLTALPGNRAAYVLATWGLVSLLPEATLHFEGEAVPVVRYGGDTDELVKCGRPWPGGADLEPRGAWVARHHHDDARAICGQRPVTCRLAGR